jgi:PEP-CTERM motif-containing protein
MLRFVRLASFGVLCFAACPAGATRIEHFLGTLTIEVFPLPALTVSGEGFATLDASHAPHVALSVPASTLAGGASRVLLTPISSRYGPASTFYPIAEVQLGVRNGPGALVDGSGAMALRGIYRACLWGTCASPLGVVDVPLTSMGNLGVGLGGTFFVPRQSNSPLDMTVVGAPWTTGAATVTTFNGATIMQHGLVRAPNGGSGFESAARHGGVIDLVSPFAIYLGDRSGFNQRYGGIATFHVEFAPEPATLVLLGAGIAGLSTAGRRRRSLQ